MSREPRPDRRPGGTQSAGLKRERLRHPPIGRDVL